MASDVSVTPHNETVDSDNSEPPLPPVLNLSDSKRIELNTTDMMFDIVSNPMKINAVKLNENRSKKIIEESDSKSGSDAKSDPGSDRGSDPGSDRGSDAKSDSGSDAKSDSGSDPGSHADSDAKSNRSNRSKRSNRSNKSQKNESVLKLDAIPLQSTEVKNPGQDNNHQTITNVEIDPKDLKMQKLDLLYKIDEYRREGYVFQKTYSVDSNIDELNYEIKRVEAKIHKKKHSQQVSQKIEFQKKMLVILLTGIELLNEKFNPMKFKLKGWSSSVKNDINNETYTDIFKDLNDIYLPSTGPGGAQYSSPETRLVMAIVGSAVMYHISQSLLAPPGGTTGSGSVTNNDTTSKSKSKKNIKLKEPKNFNKFADEIKKQFKRIRSQT